MDEFHNELPPIRSISHHIDLIPRASLPNKSTYKITPMDNEEIKNQVHDLLDEGLVRESLSPCDLPTMLRPRKNGS